MGRSTVAVCVCLGLIALSARAGEVAFSSANERDIQQREYHATLGADGAWSAPNRAQDLRFEFRTDGVVARPRTSGVDFEWGLRLASFGRDGSPMSLPRATLSSNANRVEATRGDLVEWYVNDARGLEHGFTVAASPAGRGDLVLELDVTGTLTPRARDGGIDFASAIDDAVIRYDHLVVVDADGRVLDAQMGVHDGSIRITVDDRDARYPVTIDPLTTTAVWTGESDKAGAAAGTSVASAGDVNGDGLVDLINSSPAALSDTGNVYVHLSNDGSGSGVRPRQTQVAGLPPIAPLGRMNGAKFRLAMNMRSAFGRGVTKLVLEAKPLGIPFSNAGQISTPWLSTKTSDTSSVTTPPLVAAKAYHWRARIVYSATTVPPQPATHWFSLSHNTRTETDLRTAPCGESFATSSSYGSGKPGTNGIPTLTSLTPPGLGGMSDLTLTNGLGRAGPLVYFIGFVQTALPFDGGTLLLLPQQTITLPGLPPSGSLTIPLALPAAPAFCGANVYFQAAFVDPGATGFYKLAMTPGLKWTLGS